MIRVGACDGRVTRTGKDLSDLGDLRPNGTFGDGGKRVFWFDIPDPTDADWEQLQSTFHFHPLAIEDAKQPGQRSKVDYYPARGASQSGSVAEAEGDEGDEGDPGYLFLSIRYWTGEKSKTDDLEDVTGELDIFLGPRYLVTIHNGEFDALKDTWRRWHEHPRDMPQASNSAAYLLYLLLDAVVDEYLPIVDQMDADTDKLEMQIYETDVNSTKPVDIKPALRVKKRLLLLRQTVTPLREVLNQLLRVDDGRLIPPALHVYYQDVYDHTLRLVEQVDLHRDILSGVLDAAMAQTSNRTNQVMKTLTVVSTTLMSASLIAGIYGMNFDPTKPGNMPELSLPYGYVGALALMVVVVVGLIVYFRRIRWL